jgi:predicted transglutaminase-like cysteine proteinase
MVRVGNFARIQVVGAACVAALLVACLANAGCSVSGPGGRAAGGVVEGVVAARRNAALPPESKVAAAVEKNGLDPMATGSIGTAGVFRSAAIPIRNFPVSARWAPVTHGIGVCVTGPCGDDGLLKAIDDETAGMTLPDRIRRVNDIVNDTIRYRSDQYLYGKLDHWATPAETLERLSGDCEDLAILKMTALIRAGIPAGSLSLVVLRDNRRGVFHAVLAARTASGTYILDNAPAKVALDVDLPDYQPLYSLGQAQAWIHGTGVGTTDQSVAGTADFSSIAPGEGQATRGNGRRWEFLEVEVANATMRRRSAASHL